MTILSSLHFQFCLGRLSCHEYLECNLNGDFSPKGLSLTLEKGLFILIVGFEKKSLNLTIIAFSEGLSNLTIDMIKPIWRS